MESHSYIISLTSFIRDDYIILVSHRAERQAAASGTISRVNKLVSSYSEGEGPELTQAVQELCQQADGLILVVDSSKTEGEGEMDAICIPDQRGTPTRSLYSQLKFRCHSV